MSPARLASTLLWLTLAAQTSAAQTAIAKAAGDASSNSSKPLTVSIAFSSDGGRDRFDILTVQLRAWEFQNFNWASPDGQSALSLFLIGRQFKLARWADAVVLAGPWYSYENHAWDEMVLATNFTFHGERLRVACTNYWGAPLRNSGEFVDSHTQTMTGLPHLPTWLGASILEKRSSDGLDRLFLGPALAMGRGAISVSAYPYWDVQRRTFDMRIGMSYSHVGR